ncbi:isoprenoid synthase domain-containing protein [Mycena vulgaris]|nr:isoprenoid synthase domain-containing protein [Mycena vulgaris]
MSTTVSWSSSVRLLLHDIGYRYETLPHDTNYWGSFHEWIISTLGPVCPWNFEQLTELEHAAGGVVDRGYPYASGQLKLVFAKLSAMVIVIDDSIDDPTLYDEIVQFSRKLYIGEPQDNGMLALFQVSLKELSNFYGNDAVLRDLTVLPWISFIDGCLMEKYMYATQKHESVAPSPLPNGALEPRDSTSLDGLAFKFPNYLRSKNGASEAYAAGIFKATEEQSLPLKKYIRVLPDVISFINGINDILSFHKEELAGETYNLIHLRTRALSSAGRHGSGISGDWTTNDTIRLLCDETGGATRRVDGLLRLEDCERKMRGEPGLDDLDEADVQTAKQWRGWRDGFISWHLDCRRYSLAFLKSEVLGDKGPVPTDRGVLNHHVPCDL